MDDTMICGFRRCPVAVPARLSSWFYHLAWTHRLSNAMCMELLRERQAEGPPVKPWYKVEPEGPPITNVAHAWSKALKHKGRQPTWLALVKAAPKNDG